MVKPGEREGSGVSSRREDTPPASAAERGRWRVAADGDPPWAVERRVAVPARVPSYFDRPQLARDYLPSLRRATILKAPSGFGKTTLLAEWCRAVMADDVLTAWLCLDEQDDGRRWRAGSSGRFGTLAWTCRMTRRGLASAMLRIGSGR